MKVRECFLHAAALVDSKMDAREVWAAMNAKNAPWAAVREEGGRLLGLLRAADFGEALLTPETFFTAAELTEKKEVSRRAVRLSPGAELGEAVLQMELAGADAALVEAEGRPPGVLEIEGARKILEPDSR